MVLICLYFSDMCAHMLSLDNCKNAILMSCLACHLHQKHFELVREPLHVTVHVLQNVAAVLLNIVVRAFSKYLFQEDVWHLLQAR